jgi:hypothetical protein
MPRRTVAWWFPRGRQRWHQLERQSSVVAGSRRARRPRLRPRYAAESAVGLAIGQMLHDAIHAAWAWRQLAGPWASHTVADRLQADVEENNRRELVPWIEYIRRSQHRKTSTYRADAEYAVP